LVWYVISSIFLSFSLLINFLQEAVGDTLEELWISYNQIEKLKGIGGMKKLKVLYMSNNLVKEWVEFQKLVSKNIIFQFEFIDS
jgi:dynein light chain 1